MLNLARINDAICTSTLALVNNAVDKLVEEYSPDYLPIELGNTVVSHSKSPRYQNGELIPNYFDGSILDESKQNALLEALKNRSEVHQDIRTLVNYIKITIHNAVTLANYANTYNPTEEIYFLVRLNVPDVILSDEELLKNCFNTDKEYELFKTATQGKLSDEDVQEFKDKTTYEEVLEIFDKYYTLNLLTNMN